MAEKGRGRTSHEGLALRRCWGLPHLKSLWKSPVIGAWPLRLRSRRLKERVGRAREHRLLLLSFEVQRSEIAAAVVGHTGNVYDVRIGARVLCTCLDFVKAPRMSLSRAVKTESYRG